MNVVICDDIPEETHRLKKRLGDYCAKKDWPLHCTERSFPSQLLQMDLSACRAAFLDVDMPEMSGLEVAEILHERYPELLIIFVTGYIEFAPAGYRVSAFRYLLKQQIDKELPVVLEDLYSKLLEDDKTFLIKTKEGCQIIPIRNIVYLEGTSHRRVLFHLNNALSTIEAMGSLSGYANELECKGFLKLQKSFLANMAHITKINNYYAHFDDNTVLSVSDIKYKEIQRTYLRWKGEHL